MNTQLVAIDPRQLAQEQGRLIEWCDSKLAELASELTQSHGIVKALRDAKMSDARGRRVVTSVRKRTAFYEKIKSALAAGYYILPPIPHQTFAIRSAKEAPPEKRAIGSYWKADEPTPDNLPVGEGEYHNAVAKRERVDSVIQKENGKDVEKYIYANTEWRDIEFPFFPVKPQIIEATGKALSLKIFDWLGAAPQHRSVDPMVIGCIKHYKQYSGPVHFFVAWWLDTDTL